MILELFDFKYLIILMNFNLNNNLILNSKTLIYVMIQWCAKKGPCEKNEPRNKKPFGKNFIFFVDKLNMIDFNIFKKLKLIFTCESCAISITE